jgi:hypothetical protein
MSKKKNLPQYRVAIAKRSDAQELKATALDISRTLLFIITTEFKVASSEALKLFRGINDLLDKSERSFPLLITRSSEYGLLANLKPVLPYLVCDSRLGFITPSVDKESAFINALTSWQEGCVNPCNDMSARNAFTSIASSLERLNSEHEESPAADKYHIFTFEYRLDIPSLYFVQKRKWLTEKIYKKGGRTTLSGEKNCHSNAISHHRLFDLSKKPFNLYKSATLPT